MTPSAAPPVPCEERLTTVVTCVQSPDGHPQAAHASASSAPTPEAPESIVSEPWQRLNDLRILIYSHDTFGLGHLRRCRTIAHALVERFKGLSILIVSGSPIAGAFDFQARVDFVKIPSVIKLYNGEYTSIDAHIDIHDTLALRENIILNTAQAWRPDIFIVDKEPLGLRGEIESTLLWLKAQGCRLVLGLREVMDAPELLANEWGRKGVIGKIDRLYDELWVYGPPDFWNPFVGLDVPSALLERLAYTGFLRREAPSAPALGHPALAGPPPILVTAGGGGDGASLMRQVLAAYRHDADLRLPLMLVLGPFMNAEDRDGLHELARATPKATIVDFDNRLETIVRDAAAVVAMGGYNTFCEILSFDKPALIVPRTHPRREQLIRAQRASELGMVDMLHPDEAADPAVMAQALRRLLQRPLPSRSVPPVALDGLTKIGDYIHSYDAKRLREASAHAAQGGA